MIDYISLIPSKDYREYFRNNIDSINDIEPCIIHIGKIDLDNSEFDVQVIEGTEKEFYLVDSNNNNIKYRFNIDNIDYSILNSSINESKLKDWLFSEHKSFIFNDPEIYFNEIIGFWNMLNNN